MNLARNPDRSACHKREIQNLARAVVEQYLGVTAWRTGALQHGAYRRLPMRMPSAQSRVRVLTPTIPAPRTITSARALILPPRNRSRLPLPNRAGKTILLFVRS